MLKESAADALKTTSKKVTQKTTQATDYLLGKIVPNKIKKVSRTSPQNSLERVTNEAENLTLDLPYSLF